MNPRRNGYGGLSGGGLNTEVRPVYSSSLPSSLPEPQEEIREEPINTMGNGIGMGGVGGFSTTSANGSVDTSSAGEGLNATSRGEIGLNTSIRAGLAMGGGLGSTIRPTFGSASTLPQVQQQEEQLPEATSLAALAAQRGFGFGGNESQPVPEPVVEQEPSISGARPIPGAGNFVSGGGMQSGGVGQTPPGTSFTQGAGLGQTIGVGQPPGSFVQGGGLGSTMRPPGLRTLTPGATEQEQAPAVGTSPSAPGTITFGMFFFSPGLKLLGNFHFSGKACFFDRL